jgi:hypothetical protein
MHGDYTFFLDKVAVTHMFNDNLITNKFLLPLRQEMVRGQLFTFRVVLIRTGPLYAEGCGLVRLSGNQSRSWVVGAFVSGTWE